MGGLATEAARPELDEASGAAGAGCPHADQPAGDDEVPSTRAYAQGLHQTQLLGTFDGVARHTEGHGLSAAPPSPASRCGA
jgi:hypothetical protein